VALYPKLSIDRPSQVALKVSHELGQLSALVSQEQVYVVGQKAVSVNFDAAVDIGEGPSQPLDDESLDVFVGNEPKHLLLAAVGDKVDGFRVMHAHGHVGFLSAQQRPVVSCERSRLGDE
jgi:hypothetical protein